MLGAVFALTAIATFALLEKLILNGTAFGRIAGGGMPQVALTFSVLANAGQGRPRQARADQSPHPLFWRYFAEFDPFQGQVVHQTFAIIDKGNDRIVQCLGRYLATGIEGYQRH